MKLGLAILALLVPTVILGVWTVSDGRVTDAEIHSSAPEDVIGFGFWPVWAPLTAVEFGALVALANFEKTKLRQIAILGGPALFVLATVVAYEAH